MIMNDLWCLVKYLKPVDHADIRKIVISNLCLKKYFQRHFDLLLIGDKGKRHYVLIKYFTNPCMTIHYIVQENSFIVIVYRLLPQ